MSGHDDVPLASATPCSSSSDLPPIAQRVEEQWPEPDVLPPPPPSAPPTDGCAAPPTDGCAAPHGAERHFEVDSQGAGGENLREVYECPVCMEGIAPSGAAMRCTGQAGGRCHYFHAHCLQQWVRTQRGRAAAPSCPICRGEVEIHAQRLEQFLAGSSSGGGESKYSSGNDGTKDLEDLLAKIRSLPGSIVDGWNNLTQLEITSEQLVEGASVIAGAGVGFYAGSSGHVGLSTGSWGLDRLIWENSSTSTRVATVVGYVVGTGYRWWCEASDKAEEEDDERRSRRRRSRSRR